MPPKVRELIAELQRNGFINRGGKGSHRVYYNSRYTKIVTVSGKEGNDAKPYQVKQVKEAIREVKGK